MSWKKSLTRSPQYEMLQTLEVRTRRQRARYEAQ